MARGVGGGVILPIASHVPLLPAIREIIAAGLGRGHKTTFIPLALILSIHYSRRNTTKFVVGYHGFAHSGDFTDIKQGQETSAALRYAPVCRSARSSSAARPSPSPAEQ